MLRASIGAFTITSTVERPALLQTLNVFADNNAGGFSEGTITEITVGGQSIMVSDSVACLSSLRPVTNFGAYKGAHSLGISINQQMTLVVQGTTVNASNVSVACALDPLPGAQFVKSRAQQALNYNVLFGTGQVAIPAIAGPVPGQVTSIATSNRACTLGQLLIQNNNPAIPSQDLVISSIKISGLEMLAGPTGNQEISIAQFAADAGDVAGSTLGYEIAPMARVEITYLNYNAAIATVCGAIFCEPWTTQTAPQMTHGNVATSQTLRRLKRG
jgi:hypothetical protein